MKFDDMENRCNVNNETENVFTASSYRDDEIALD